ncbi:hypothetical protein F4677DRAFT_430689 [Hypoxylon crocopeplum]|nr:hypothetical protein F4677DRAFT_430689 [Hypoxylon crocopeplum]
MLPATSMVTFGGYRALFHAPPRGTCSRIISLRLHRRSSKDGISPCPSRNLHQSTRGFATATATHSAVVISDQEFALYRDLLDRAGQKSQTEDSHRDAVSARRSHQLAGAPIANLPARDLAGHLPSPFQRALEALQRRDTRRLLIYLQQISNMGDLELQGAVAALPRTTFTEFLRSLDPLCVAADADPTDQTNLSVGIYQTLDMGDTIDDWGVRTLYMRLLRRMLVLISALKASGQILLPEEYIYLLRCAGAASDPMGAKWIWNEMVRTQTTEWRQSEAYTEYISARFLTRPLYTGYDKTRRMVIPRNLHRSRLRLLQRRVQKLDRLRFNIRLGRLRFGLNKDVKHAEDIMRMMRKKGAPTRLFYYILNQGHRATEPLLCALMVALGRVGSLRFTGSRILNDYFGIRMRQLTYEDGYKIEPAPDRNEISRVPFRIRPSMRLIQAVVEAYGSNGEVAIACRLIDHISKTYNMPIPLSIWQDLLEWSYIMSSPATSTAWKLAGMPSKIPSNSTIEVIWDTMTSEPYQVQPGFEQYNILIRNLLGRHQFSKILPYIRRAVDLYNVQCQEYEEAVFEYVQMLRDGVRMSETVHRYERARFMKEKMWYDIQTWCRKFLLSVRSLSPENPLATVVVPDFVRELRPFIPNPARYRTATGYVSLTDPARECPVVAFTTRLPVDIPMMMKRKWRLQRVMLRRTAIYSSHSMRGHAPISKFDLLTLLTSANRTVRPLGKILDELEGDSGAESDASSKISGSTTESSFDDDDDYF